MTFYLPLIVQFLKVVVSHAIFVQIATVKFGQQQIWIFQKYTGDVHSFQKKKKNIMLKMYPATKFIQNVTTTKIISLHTHTHNYSHCATCITFLSCDRLVPLDWNSCNRLFGFSRVDDCDRTHGDKRLRLARQWNFIHFYAWFAPRWRPSYRMRTTFAVVRAYVRFAHYYYGIANATGSTVTGAIMLDLARSSWNVFLRFYRRRYPTDG